MDASERIAYINAMVVCAQIEAEGMKAENQYRVSGGESIAYGKEQFDSLIEKYGIHHNAVLGYLREGR